jgi:branched-chain amino acid transport system permease protein
MGTVAAPVTRLVLPAALLGVGAAALAVFPDHLLYTSSTALWYGLVALGLYLPMAALQELPLHGAGLAGMSAYLFSYMAQQGGVDNLMLGIAFAVGAAVVASLLAGLASLAVTGLYFTVASLVVQTYIERTIFPIGELTLGASGRGVPRPQLDGWFNTNRAVFLIAASVALVVSTAVWAVSRTRLLPVWVMTGHQPDGADAVGIRRPLHKLTVFGLSGLLIGMAGCLAAFVNGTPPSVPQFNWIWSVLFVAIPLASGMRTISALWLVAAGYIAIPVLLEDYRINPNLMAGAILLFAVVAARAHAALMARLRRGVLTPGHDVTPATVSVGRTRPTAELARRSRPLVGTNIAVHFGGVRAVDGIDIRVMPGQRVALTGANGAGKTTMLNALCGFVPLTGGTVRLGEEDLTRLPAYERARAGLGRTFQLPRLAEVLTVRQSLECGHGYSRDQADRLDWLMECFWVRSVAEVPIGMLSFGYRRRTEIVRALVAQPDVLLLDEPTGGLEDEEVEKLVEVILDLRTLEGWGLLVIEHNMSFVTAVAEHVTVMQDGKLITEGPTAEVMADERVRRIYLGEQLPFGTVRT